MDQTFEKNRKRPDDPDFKYDVEVDFTDFTSGQIETSGWDSDDDNNDNGFQKCQLFYDSKLISEFKYACGCG